MQANYPDIMVYRMAPFECLCDYFDPVGRLSLIGKVSALSLWAGLSNHTAICVVPSTNFIA
jgi:hypothetical protein